MQTLMSPYPLPLIFAVPQPFLCSLSGTQMLTPWVSDQKCDAGFLQPWTLRKPRQVQEGSFTQGQGATLFWEELLFN